MLARALLKSAYTPVTSSSRLREATRNTFRTHSMVAVLQTAASCYNTNTASSVTFESSGIIRNESRLIVDQRARGFASKAGGSRGGTNSKAASSAGAGAGGSTRRAGLPPHQASISAPTPAQQAIKLPSGDIFIPKGSSGIPRSIAAAAGAAAAGAAGAGSAAGALPVAMADGHDGVGDDEEDTWEVVLPDQPFRKYLDIHPAVQAALDGRQAVVALESTIISHGMPYPQNVETARAVEDIVRRGGAVPATIAIMDGKIKIGLDEASLEVLGKAGHEARKVSRRDFASTIAGKQIGATTVAGTMIAAHMAGISVFVTGGIGGVHRGVEETMDVSADLTELARTPVAVVCAGVKSILDIPRTLEYLETQGVPVVSFQASQFPAFFSPASGCASPERVDSAEQVAAQIHASSELQLGNGMVIAVPCHSSSSAAAAAAGAAGTPSSSSASSPSETSSSATASSGGAEAIEGAIQTALQEASSKGIKGKETTPFLLQRVNELTSGASLKVNIELVKNNARVGTAIAVELARIRQWE